MDRDAQEQLEQSHIGKTDCTHENWTSPQFYGRLLLANDLNDATSLKQNIDVAIFRCESCGLLKFYDLSILES
jgi:hypothetical protein